jgi:hypothetical protein
MTVYEIPNIEHCTVTEFSNGGMFRIVTNEGWYIHLPQHEENSYTTAVILRETYDFSTVQIIPASELPPDAEFNGGDAEHETT